MPNITDTNIKPFGVPVHNPPYRSKKLSCRFNLVKLDIDVVNTEIIHDIIPKPLEWVGTNIFISANKVVDYQGYFASYIKDSQWNEILIQIPVQYNKTFYYYNCEIFTTHFGIISCDREMYGFPKIPANIDIQMNGRNLKTIASHFGSGREICVLEFEWQREASVNELGIKPKIINLRNVPHPYANETGDSIQQLIALKYKKQKIREMGIGKADLKLLDWFPHYIKEAQVKNIHKAVYIDVELEIEGGKLVYDYNERLTPVV